MSYSDEFLKKGFKSAINIVFLPIINDFVAIINDWGRIINDFVAIINDQERIINDFVAIINDRERIINDFGVIINDWERIINDRERIINDRGKIINDCQNDLFCIIQKILKDSFHNPAYFFFLNLLIAAPFSGSHHE